MSEYDRAVTLDPAFAHAWAQLARASCSIAGPTLNPADVDRCKTAAERAITLAPNRPESRLAMGNYYRTIRREPDKALLEYAAGLRNSPSNADLLASSATIERILGRSDEALTHLILASQLDPRSVIAATNLARCYSELHRHADAQREFGRATALAPSNLSLVQAKATDFLAQGDLKGAHGVIADALARVDSKALIVRFATFQEMMWALPDELRARVVELQPADFDNDRGMWALKVGNTYRLMGKMSEARSYGDIAAAAYTSSAKANPKDPQQQELYARALALAGRNQEATQVGERTLALRSTVLDAINGPYYKYQVARVYLQAGMNDRAIELIEPLLSQPGFLTPAWLTIDPIFAPLKGNSKFERLIAKR
jgi:tetratricopeptide (TPR) repeat protein